jgi:hypothetical protein
MNAAYSTDLYQKREIDEALGQQSIGWLRPSAHLRWISLHTQHGRGNTWLLGRFEEWINASDAHFNGLKVMRARGDPARYPAPAGPLVTELARLNHESQRSPLQYALRRIRRAPLVAGSPPSSSYSSSLSRHVSGPASPSSTKPRRPTGKMSGSGSTASRYSSALTGTNFRSG